MPTLTHSRRHRALIRSPLARTALASGVLLALLSACGQSPGSDTGATGGAAPAAGGLNSGVGGSPSSGGAATGGGNTGGASAGGAGGAGTTGGSGNNGSGGSAVGGSDATGSGGENSGTGGAAPSTCVPDGKAHNPLVTQIFTADPNAIVYGDRVYVYTSHDEDGQDGFDMVDYHAFSSDDMVNWQDHGVLIHANQLPWAANLYAPGACSKGGQYYIYIPNSGSAIGVGVSDDPGGPFTDPLGRALITPSFPNANVPWLFDPACFIDDDGQAYLYFGGGESGANARAVRLN